jgi:hypothetical protein
MVPISHRLLGRRRQVGGAVFGQAMGLVALTVGCLVLGAYIGRNLADAARFAFFAGAFICMIGGQPVSDGASQRFPGA